jgi:steroid delta-isomerase-like uncharacterized protein
MTTPATIQDPQAQNVALYRRFIDDGVGIGRLDTVDETLAPAIELPTIAGMVPATRDGLKLMNQGFRSAFPDLHATIDEIFAFGDWVAARLTWTGTNTGDFMGQPPTGKTISITEIEIVRCENGRIVDLRQLADMASLMAQLAG